VIFAHAQSIAWKAVRLATKNVAIRKTNCVWNKKMQKDARDMEPNIIA
jgi:hypothetical protein